MHIAFLFAASLSAAALAQAPPPSRTVPSNPAAVPAAAGQTSGKPLVFRELFTVENYPYQALIRSMQGPISATLTIGTDGRVNACSTNPNAPSELAAGTCELIIAKARFEPARDLTGKAVDGEFRQTVRWVLEDNDPMAFEAAHERFVVRFEADGVVESCSQQVSHAAMADPRGCEGAKENAVSFADEIPESLKREDIEVVFETIWRPGSDAPDFPGSDDPLVSVEGSHMDIAVAANGRVTHCAVLRSGVWGPEFMDMRCKTQIGILFKPDSASKRRMQIVDFIYVRPRQAGVIS